MPNCGLLYIQFVVVYCSVVGLRNATVAEYVCTYSPPVIKCWYLGRVYCSNTSLTM